MRPNYSKFETFGMIAGTKNIEGSVATTVRLHFEDWTTIKGINGH